MSTKGRAPSTKATAPNGLAAAPEGLTAGPTGLAAAREGLTAGPTGLTATREDLTAGPSGLTGVPDGLGSDGGSRTTRNGLGRERVIDIQRARMLAAMFDVVSERGASNASVAHVVARSGVSRRTFYELFDDREDCFIAAFEEAVTHASERVLDSYDARAPWRARIRAALAALLQFLDDQPAMGRLLVVEALGAGPRALERRARVLAQAIAAVEEGRAEAKPGKKPPPLTAEGVVGAVFSVIHTRMLEQRSGSLLELTSPLMNMIVLPYLGVAVARKELERPTPERSTTTRRAVEDPLRDLEMRLTYRTVRVLMAIATHPHASNRQIADIADVSDQGQMSKLLARLQHLGLIENASTGNARGEPNAWTLTTTGHNIQQTIHQPQQTKN
jgi:AcrR family transcriptional regulator/DNA-binding MarR family transcriptional regulator